MTPLKAYEKAANNLARAFVEKYYGDAADFDDPDTCWWVADHAGGVIAVNDYFWSMGDIHEAMRLDAPVDKLFKWYEHRMDDKADKYNLYSFLSLTK